MYCSNHDISRTLVVVVFIYITITAAIMFSFTKGYQYFTIGRDSICQNEEKSNEKSEQSFEDIILKADKMISNLENQFQHGIEKKTDVYGSVTVLMTQMKEFMAKLEHKLPEFEIQSFLSQPIINDHNFSYIHNPVGMCASENITLIILVPSSTTNFEKREIMRNGSSGYYVKNLTNNSRMLFFLGRPFFKKNSTKIQRQIDEEAKTFGNIVQENFEDIYSNNRLKAVSMLRWVGTYCPNAKYVIRSDDDINANISSLLSILNRTAGQLDNFIIGKQRINDVPARNLNNKYYLSETEYPPPIFPPYLLGGLLGYPISTVRLLFEAALRVKPIWLEDIYITGICAPKVHVPILTFEEFNFAHHEEHML